jgi:putative tryptophan/tyrosine transport system substrate-binding protein
VSTFISALGPKQLEILHEILPSAGTIVLLVNASNPNAQADAPEEQEAAHVLGQRLEVLTASTDGDLEAVFTTMGQRRAGALIVKADPFFIDRRERLVALAARHAMPAIYSLRVFADVGGLVSYGIPFVDLFQQVGTYAGKILSGAKPAAPAGAAIGSLGAGAAIGAGTGLVAGRAVGAGNARAADGSIQVRYDTFTRSA